MSKRYFSDMKRLKEMKDEDIDTSDIPELDDAFFENAVIRWPEPKASVTLRIDREVLDWFKSQGKGYQTHMNAVLKAYKEAKAKASEPTNA
jgi:uncharacterized protein (DUF4415 family)